MHTLANSRRPLLGRKNKTKKTMSLFLKSSSMVAINCVWLLLLVLHNSVQAQMKIFDVKQYGGVADEKTDNSKAFMDAWNEACKNNGGGVVLFQKGIYLVNPLAIQGPCKGPMELQIQGTLLASREKQYSVGIDHWINFQHIDNFVVTGGGTLDGRGASAWPYNDCRRNKHCKPLPASLMFDFASNTKIHNITSLNSKNTHFHLFACLNLTISNVNISAPAKSPNTDGIKVGNSINIQIYDSVIATGDDCISFLPESRNISVNHIHCGPGHGISIGSMSSSSITDLRVTDCSFVGTENGVRIKTKSPSEPGTVSDVKFEHIEIHEVNNPIIIDQQYCAGSGCTETKITSEIQITGVNYTDIWGTSNTETAVTLKCSENKPCENIELKDINLHYNKGGRANELCLNAKGVASGKENSSSCLQS